MNDRQMHAFSTVSAWRSWLEKHHATSEGIWIRFYKKASHVPSITYAEALDEALCCGWIDGQAKPYDEQSWLQGYSPRRSRSMWSKRNTEHIERLSNAGKMMPAGLEQVRKAKEDGRWEKAYASPSDMTVPEEFLDEVQKYPKAHAFFQTLNKTNTYAIAWRIRMAKRPETKEKRIKTIIEMLIKGEKFH